MSARNVAAAASCLGGQGQGNHKRRCVQRSTDQFVDACVWFRCFDAHYRKPDDMDDGLLIRGFHTKLGQQNYEICVAENVIGSGGGRAALLQVGASHACPRCYRQIGSDE